jgi:hypothetical protein
VSDPRATLADQLADRRHDPDAPSRAECARVIDALTRRWQATGFHNAFRDMMTIYRGRNGAPEERGIR